MKKYEKDFQEVLNYLSNKEWLLKNNYKEVIKELKQKAKTSNDMNLKRAVKNYTKYFKQPLKFEHNLNTYITGRVFAQYVLFPNKPIDNVKLKELIIPKPNYYFVSFDFKTSQIRHIAARRNITKLKKMINEGKDIYIEFAKELNITRNQAKLSLFVLNFGGSVNTIQEKFKDELSDKTIELIYDTFEKWFEMENMTYEEKVKLNHIIQKDEVTFFKRKLNYLYKKQNNFWNLHAFIHDDIILEIHKDHLYYTPKIKKFLEKYTPIKMQVKTKVSKTFQFD